MFIIFPERKCGQTAPTPFQGMDITWPYKRRELGIYSFTKNINLVQRYPFNLLLIMLYRLPHTLYSNMDRDKHLFECAM